MSEENRGIEAAQKLSKLVNSMANQEERKSFVDEITNDHRTLQQQSFGLMAECLKAWSEVEHTDLRNEDTVRQCKELFDKFPDFGGVRFI